MTTPIRGLGENEVDLRGMRTPRAATAITSARSGGLTATTKPAARAVAPSAWSRLWW